ncbi:MAG: hypothetical protein U0519_01995 [Candidatus Gracilibacteria bacterium]
MGLRKFEQADDITQEQLEGLAANDNNIDSGTIKDINDIRKTMETEMAKAKMDGILSEKDADELQQELTRSSADKGAVMQVANKVKNVINENKSLLDTFVKGLTSERDIGDKLVVDDHIRQFKALSTEEKRTYVKNLRKNLDWVNTLYQEVLKHSPEKLDQFRRMSGKEKKDYVEELKKRSGNIAAYRKLIENNREHFSKESEAEYMTQFKELKTVAEQERWIKDFPKEIERKAEVTNKFKAFPPEFQAKFPEFLEARRTQRLVILQKMERALEEAHLDVLNNDPNAKHFSEKDRTEAMKWWKVSSVDIRVLMLKSLPGHLKKTAELSAKYEKMDDTVRLDVQQKMGFTSFYELDFATKTKVIEEGRKLGESGDKLTVQYEGKLRDAVAKKYMAKTTYDSFMKEFKDLPTEEKAEWVQKFETHELAKRREITERFQNEVPADLQAKNAGFYEQGYHDRVKILAKLLGVDENDVNAGMSEAEKSAEKTAAIEQLANQAQKLEREGNNAASRDLKQEKWGEALIAYEKLLKLDPADEIAASNHQRLSAKFIKTFPDAEIPKDNTDQTLNEHEVDEALERTKQGGVMKEKMKRQTIAEELTDLAAKSEQYNANTFDSRMKNKHLGTEFDRELNEELLAHTGGEMVLNKDGTAETIQTVDVKNIHKLEANEIHGLKHEVVTHRGDKGQNVHNLQLNNRESGQILNARTAKEQTEKQKEKLQQELAEQAAIALKARGKKLTKKDMDDLYEAAANDSMYVKLQEAA